MFKFLLGTAILGALVLATGCASATNSSTKAVYDARVAYDAAVLIPIEHYTALPFCNAAPAIVVCKTAEVQAQLLKADATAKLAMDTAEAFVLNPANAQLDATSVMNAATSAVAAATAVVSSYNLK